MKCKNVIVESVCLLISIIIIIIISSSSIFTFSYNV